MKISIKIYASGSNAPAAGGVLPTHASSKPLKSAGISDPIYEQQKPFYLLPARNLFWIRFRRTGWKRFPVLTNARIATSVCEPFRGRSGRKPHYSDSSLVPTSMLTRSCGRPRTGLTILSGMPRCQTPRRVAGCAQDGCSAGAPGFSRWMRVRLSFCSFSNGRYSLTFFQMICKALRQQTQDNRSCRHIPLLPLSRQLTLRRLDPI